MGRTNKSRKRREENSKAKKARYDVKELARLKKTLGIADNVDETMKDISDVATIKTPREIKIVSIAKQGRINIS